MWARELNAARTFAGRGEHGADLLDEITSFCVDHGIKAGSISAIGALKSAHLGYYDQKSAKYVEFSPSGGGLEILSLSGNVSIKEDKPFCHVHLVVGDEEGRAFGGHLMHGCEIFALEFFITEYEGADLVRLPDEATKLALWRK